MTKQRLMDFLYVNVCLLIGGMIAYVYMKHISFPFGLLFFVINSLYVLLAMDFMLCAERAQDDLARPLQERILLLSPRLFFQQICRRGDAVSFFSADMVHKEQKRRHPSPKAQASHRTAHLYLCLLMQINVWCHVAICLAKHRDFPLWIALAGLAVAMTLEHIRWMRRSYRPYRAACVQWDAFKEELVTMPAVQLEELLHWYERVYRMDPDERKA